MERQKNRRKKKPAEKRDNAHHRPIKFTFNCDDQN